MRPFSTINVPVNPVGCAFHWKRRDPPGFWWKSLRESSFFSLHLFALLSSSGRSTFHATLSVSVPRPVWCNSRPTSVLLCAAVRLLDRLFPLHTRALCLFGFLYLFCYASLEICFLSRPRWQAKEKFLLLLHSYYTLSAVWRRHMRRTVHYKSAGLSYHSSSVLLPLKNGTNKHCLYMRRKYNLFYFFLCAVKNTPPLLMRQNRVGKSQQQKWQLYQFRIQPTWN